MMMITLRKSIVLPLLSVSRPLSITCKEQIKDIRMGFFNLIKQKHLHADSDPPHRSASRPDQIQHNPEAHQLAAIPNGVPYIRTYQSESA
jgi:hypothetical protein